MEKVTVASAKHITSTGNGRGYNYIIIWVMRDYSRNRIRQQNHCCANFHIFDELLDRGIAQLVHTAYAIIAQHAGKFGKQFRRRD
jgi:hypothetical protein